MTDETTATDMGTFFQRKVENIYSDIETKIAARNLDLTATEHLSQFGGIPLTEFKTITESDLKEVITSLNNKDSPLDPIPIKLFNKCLNELTPMLLYIVNKSLSSGVFPSQLKSATVRPVIKDENGDTNDYKNYRPISNLAFLSKILEKCVLKQLSHHLDTNNLHAEHQSGYRPNHSCETATLAVYNDLLCISVTKKQVVLLLLDLSAAFDTINHTTLLRKLRVQFGINSTVLNWFNSYLDSRSFTVKIGDSKSTSFFLRIGVPQGSILGPILFILYIKDLEDIARKHGFSIHLYADDSQLYLEFNPLIDSVNDFKDRILTCLSEIKDWMMCNHLKLNAEKTELLFLKQRYGIDINNLDLITSDSGEPITPSTVVKSLGVYIDNSLTFEDQVNAIVKGCNINLRNLYMIGSKLSFDLKKQLIHSLIHSKLDYCNGLLFGLPQSIIQKLQHVQNAAVKFLFGYHSKSWVHATTLLEKAHFLPVHHRIFYKIALMTYKCINNIAPAYLANNLTLKPQPLKLLRKKITFIPQAEIRY